MIFGIDKVPKEQPAFISEEGNCISYAELKEEILKVSEALEAGRYENKKTLVFCLCKNVPEAAAGYLGILEQGSVSLLLGENLDRAQLEMLDKTYRPSYYWRPVREGERPVLKIGEYGLFETGNPPVEMNSSLALLLSSSGSTGSPKLIRLSRKNLEANASSIAEYLELDENERPMTVLPMQYTFGLSVINSHLTAGACIIMTTKSIVQQEFWDLLKQYKGTSLAGVPYTYEILKRIHFMEREGIDSLTSLLQAGGHLPVELQELYGRWAMANGLRFYVMYGQTEATARMSYLPWQDVLRKIGTIGVAIPGGRFELLGADGQIIQETDTAGELIYYGDNVSLGYASEPEDLKKEDERRGRLATGDVASVDKDGYYTIRGRLNRFVKLYGVRVGLDECENILKGLDVDAEFACTGTDDVLYIYTDSERAGEAAAYLAGKLKLNIRGFEAVYVSQIPKTENGKKDYRALKQLNLKQDQ